MIKTQHYPGPKPFSVYTQYPRQSREEMAQELKTYCLSFSMIDKMVSLLSSIPKAHRVQGDKLVLQAINASRDKAPSSPQSWMKVANFCKGEERFLHYLFDKPKYANKTALRWIIDTRDMKSLYALWPCLPAGDYEREHIAVGKGGIGEWMRHGWGIKALEKNGDFFVGSLTFFQPDGQGWVVDSNWMSTPVRGIWRHSPKSEIVIQYR